MTVVTARQTVESSSVHRLQERWCTMFGMRMALRDARRTIETLQGENAKMVKLMTRLADNAEDLIRSQKQAADKVEEWSLRMIATERESCDVKKQLADARCLIDCQNKYLDRAGLDPAAIEAYVLRDGPRVEPVTQPAEDEGGKRICTRCGHEWMLLVGDYPADGVCTACRQAIDESEPGKQT